MKRWIMGVMLTFTFPGLLSAEIFSPNQLRIIAEPVITYDFDGQNLEIPFTVTGTNAGVLFLVYTKDMASSIPESRNGYLGWHHVNRVDTCIYYSRLHSMQTGENTIVWGNGLDQDGNPVAPDTYTYYLWAYDNQGAMQQATGDFLPKTMQWAMITDIHEYDTDGLPLSQPIVHRPGRRWSLGSPIVSTAADSCEIVLEEGWAIYGRECIDPHDLNAFFVQAGNSEKKVAGIRKYQWISGGKALPREEFGHGLSMQFVTCSGGNTGVASDGTYLYTADNNNITSTSPDAEFYIYDLHGRIFSEIDLTEWWSSNDDLDVGGQMNGGPGLLEERNGKIFLNSHTSCVKQMVDPIRYLESGDSRDFFIWTNLNGDYTADHNFEDTANLRWVCNDYNVGPYMWGASTDDFFFTQITAYDVGAVTFALLGPDGTGLGYYATAGETAGFKGGTLVVDNGSAYDGIYRDSHRFYSWKVAATESSIEGSQYKDKNLYFLGHDVISGIITDKTSHFQLVSPSTGSRIGAGSEFTVRWTSFGVETLNILYSPDDGENWETIASGIPADSGEFEWSVPDFPAATCWLKIENADDTASYVLSGSFEIAEHFITVTGPAGNSVVYSGNTVVIKWQSNKVDTVDIDVSYDNGLNWTRIADTIDVAGGSYDWTIPKMTAVDCLIRLSDSSDSEIADINDSTFEILTPVLHVLAPNGTFDLLSGTVQAVLWSAISVETVTIEYSLDGGISWETIVDNFSSDLNKYDWLIPDADCDQCLLRVSDSDGFAEAALSKEFTITPPYISVLAPDGGEVYESDVTYIIRWESLGVESADIFYSRDYGTTWNTVISGVEAPPGFFSWDVPSVKGDTFLIKVADSENPPVHDVSDNYFRILESTLDLTYPVGVEEWTARTDQRVTWTASPDLQDLKIELSIDGGDTWHEIADNIESDAGEYSLYVPLVDSKDCYLRLMVHDHSGMHAVNSEPFSITAPEPGPGWTLYNNDDWLHGWAAELMADPVKGVWVSSGGEGMSYFDGKVWSFISAPGVSVDAMIIERSGETAFDFLRQENGKWVYANDVPPQSYRTIVDHTGIIWGGSYAEGLHRFDGENCITYTIKNSGIISNAVHTLAVDNENSIWVGGGTGVSKFDGMNWYNYTTENGLHSDNILAIAVSEDGHVWFGAFEGIAEFDGENWIHHLRGPTQYNQEIVEDHNGYIWAVNQHGVARYNGNGWRIYNENNSIYAMGMPDAGAVDNDNTKWFQAYRGVIRYEDDFPSYIDMLSPEGYEYVDGGETLSITWLSSQVETLSIEYSLDNGESWISIADNIPASLGKYYWTTPQSQSDQCRIRLLSTDNPAISDSSDASFRISSPMICIMSPNGGELWEPGTEQYIVWNGIGVDRFLVEYSVDGGNAWIYAGESNARSLSWTVPDDTIEQCLVRVSDASNPDVYSVSDSFFSTKSSFISIITHSEPGNYTVKDNFNIAWDMTTGIRSIDIALSFDAGHTWKKYFKNIDASLYGYTLRLPIVESNNCLVRIYDSKNPEIYDTMEEPFAIIKPEKWNGWNLYTAEDGIGNNEIQCVAVDDRGKILVGTEDVGAAMFDGETWTNYSPDNSGITSAGIYAVAFAPDGSMWFAPYSSGGLCSFDGEEWRTYPDGPPGSQAMTFDNAGNLWVGGYDNAIYRYNGSSWINWTIINCSRIKAITADDEHGVYAGFVGSSDTRGGLFRYENGGWTDMTGLYSVSKQAVGDIMFDSEGTMWIGQPVTLKFVASDVAFTVRPAVVTYDGTDYTLLPESNEHGEGVIAVDHNGVLWIGSHSSIFSYSYGMWREYTPENSAFPGMRVRDIAVDAENRKLIATQGGGLAIFDDSHEPRLRLLSPNGGEIWDGGETKTITWKANNVPRVRISLIYYQDLSGGSRFVETIAEEYDGGKGSLEIAVPNVDSDFCVIRIESLDQESAYDESDSDFTIRKTIGVDENKPFEYALKQNSPNPFNPATSIPFSLGETTDVTLEVFTITGEKIAEMQKERLAAGDHSVMWNASGFASGVYFYRIRAGEFVETRKMLLVK